MIAEAAVEVITRKGLLQTGARDIAAQANVSLGTVTHHFGSVSEILFASLRLLTEQFELKRERQLASDTQPLDRYLNYIGSYFDTNVHPTDLWRLWFEYRPLIPHVEEMRVWQFERYRQVSAKVAVLHQECIDASIFDPGIDPDDFTKEIMAFIDGLSIQLFADQVLSAPECRERVVQSVCRQLVLPTHVPTPI